MQWFELLNFFQNMIGEWKLQEESGQLIPTKSTILGHVLHRMFSLVAPTPVNVYKCDSNVVSKCKSIIVLKPN